MRYQTLGKYFKALIGPGILLCFALSITTCDARGAFAIKRELRSVLPEAERIVYEGFNSDNTDIKNTAVRMMAYLQDEKVFDLLLGLLESQIENNSSEITDNIGMYEDALASIYKTHPQKALSWLHNHNDNVLMSFNLFTFFSIIGFDKIPTFDNIFYIYITHDYEEYGIQLLYPIIYSEHYLQTLDKKYERVIRFGSGGETPEEMLFIYNYKKERNLPLQKMIFTMQHRGKVLHGEKLTGRSLSLEELLYQALLYRLGHSDAVYEKTRGSIEPSFAFGPEAIAKYDVPSQKVTTMYNIPDYALFPSLAMNIATAHLYAGVPERNHVETFLQYLHSFPDQMKYRYVQIALDSPPTTAKQLILRSFLLSEDMLIRKLVLNSALDGVSTVPEDVLLAILGSVQDPSVISSVLEILGMSQSTDHISVYKKYLAAENPIAQIAAAGQLLRLSGATQ